MRVLRLLLSLAAAAGSALLPATAALAEPYPPPPPSLTVSPDTVVVGGSVVLVGNHYGPTEPVLIEVTYQTTGGARFNPARAAAVVPAAFALPMVFDHSVTTDAQGHFRTIVHLTRVGTAVITATGSTSGITRSVTVTVLAAAGHPLPVTGDSGQSLSMLKIGAGAVAAGILLLLSLVLFRRRTKAKKADPSGYDA
jgi:hypothetical protein